MIDKDILRKFLFENFPVRGELVHLYASYQEILNQHAYPAFIRKILGEVLVAAVLLTATVKLKGRITVQFQGKGKLKLLLAQCTHQFQIRGLAQWDNSLLESEVEEAFHNGLLCIMIDPEGEGKRYQGTVAWQGNSIAQSIEGYFRDSEQLPTRLWLAVDEKCAAGFLLQIMPDGRNKNFSLSDEHFEGWEHATHLGSTIKKEELLTLSDADLLHRLYHQDNVRVFEPRSVEFRCTCSVKRSENALLLLGRDEVEAELQDKQKIVVTCEFCNHEYEFDRVDVARIFSQDEMLGQKKLH